MTENHMAPVMAARVQSTLQTQSTGWLFTTALNIAERPSLPTTTAKKLPLVVMDVCPGCQSDNHVDMGLEALIELTGSVKNACAIDRPPAKITWDFTDAAAISLPIVVPNHVRLANRTQAFVSTIFTKTMVFPVTASKKVFAAPKTATYVAPTAEAGTGGFGVVSGAASEGSLLLGSFAFLQLLLSIRP
jgi:hypothetical protein